MRPADLERLAMERGGSVGPSTAERLQRDFEIIANMPPMPAPVPPWEPAADSWPDQQWADPTNPLVSRWVIEIPGYLPPSLNVLIHCHWTKKHKLKKECTNLVAHYGAKVPRKAVKRRVRLTLTRSGRRRLLDADNAWKAILDALVACKLIVDDGPDYVECAELVQVKGPTNSTTITLEDIE